MTSPETTPPPNFIRAIVEEDLKSNKYDGRVVTRFPPELNGYLHIGHAKSMCLNFGIAAENKGGYCNLRFDDTKPTKEDVEYVDAIKNDVKWLGFEWQDREHFASDYFDQLYYKFGGSINILENSSIDLDLKNKYSGIDQTFCEHPTFKQKVVIFFEAGEHFTERAGNLFYIRGIILK